MFCPACGSPLPGTARFCRACGKPVPERAPAAPSTAQRLGLLFALWGILAFPCAPVTFAFVDGVREAVLLQASESRWPDPRPGERILVKRVTMPTITFEWTTFAPETKWQMNATDWQVSPYGSAAHGRFDTSCGSVCARSLRIDGFVCQAPLIHYSNKSSGCSLRLWTLQDGTTSCHAVLAEPITAQDAMFGAVERIELPCPTSIRWVLAAPE